MKKNKRKIEILLIFDNTGINNNKFRFKKYHFTPTYE